MGGPEAAKELNKLILGGYPKTMSWFVEAVANAEEKEAAEAAAAFKFATERSNKRKFAEMPSLRMRLNIWKRLGTKEFASLTKFVQRLLVSPATS
jgi:hypothetical protein